MIRVVLGLAVGYVLGAKAGRERYNQIMRLGTKIRGNAAVQATAGFVHAKVTSLLPGKREPQRPDMAYLVDDAEPPAVPLRVAR